MLHRVGARAQHGRWPRHPFDRPTLRRVLCSRWTSGCTNQLTRDRVVCACSGIEGAVKVMMSDQRGSGRWCTVLGHVHSTGVSHDTRLIDPPNAVCW